MFTQEHSILQRSTTLPANSPCLPSHLASHPTWPATPPCPPSHPALPANQPSLPANQPSLHANQPSLPTLPSKQPCPPMLHSHTWWLRGTPPAHPAQATCDWKVYFNPPNILWIPQKILCKPHIFCVPPQNIPSTLPNILCIPWNT